VEIGFTRREIEFMLDLGGLEGAEGCVMKVEAGCGKVGFTNKRKRLSLPIIQGE